MSTLARFLAFTRLKDESPTLALLRSPLWPLVVAVFSESFEGSSRRISSGEFYESLDRDLIALRDVGADAPGSA